MVSSYSIILTKTIFLNRQHLRVSELQYKLSLEGLRFNYNVSNCYCHLGKKPVNQVWWQTVIPAFIGRDQSEYMKHSLKTKPKLKTKSHKGDWLFPKFCWIPRLTTFYQQGLAPAKYLFWKKFSFVPKPRVVFFATYCNQSPSSWCKQSYW